MIEYLSKVMKKYTLGTSKESIMQMIPERSVKKIILGDKNITLVRVAAEFYAFQGYCPHRGAPLYQGYLNNTNEIICPLHQYRFDIRSGEVKSGACPDLETFPTQLTDQGLEISIP